MINTKAGIFFLWRHLRAGFSGRRRVALFTGTLVLSLLFFNLFVNEAQGKSVSSVVFTAGQSAALTYGTAATVTFEVTVNIIDSPNPPNNPPSVTLSASPAISGVTYEWYDSTNTTAIIWPRNVPNSTTYVLRVTTTANAWATSGTTITATDSGSGLSGSDILTIDRAALTITAATNTKTYDGTTNAAAIPNVTGLQGSDTVTGLAESYVDKTAGIDKAIDVTAYTVNDGNNGNNYAVTTVSDTTGVIDAKTLTVTGITANDKVYDGNTVATLNNTGAALVGVVSGDDVQLVTASAVGAFSDSAVGTNKTVYVSGLTLSGADAGNYSLTQPTTTASITGYTLVVNIAGNGEVVSDPAGISCISPGCSAQFDPLSTVKLTATNLDACPSSITWSGACVGNGSTCDVTMTSHPTTEDVTFTVFTDQVKNMRTGALYNTIQDAYVDDVTISGDVLKASNSVYASFDFNLTKDIEVQGGYDCNFTDPAIGVTTLSTLDGPVVISYGSVVMGGIVIN